MKVKREFAFAYLDGNEWDEYLRFYGVTTEQLPCALVIHERVGEEKTRSRIDREVFRARVHRAERHPSLFDARSAQ